MMGPNPYISVRLHTPYVVFYYYLVLYYIVLPRSSGKESVADNFCVARVSHHFTPRIGR